MKFILLEVFISQRVIWDKKIMKFQYFRVLEKIIQKKALRLRNINNIRGNLII